MLFRREYIFALIVLAGCAGCHNQSSEPVTTSSPSSGSSNETRIASKQPSDSQSFIGEWLCTEPLSFQTTLSYTDFNIHATLYQRVTLLSDRSGTWAIRTTNETPNKFKQYCEWLAVRGDTDDLEKVQIFYPMYHKTTLHWSQENDVEGNYIDVTTKNGHIDRYRWSLNDEGNLMTLTSTSSAAKSSEIYKRITAFP